LSRTEIRKKGRERKKGEGKRVPPVTVNFFFHIVKKKKGKRKESDLSTLARKKGGGKGERGGGDRTPSYPSRRFLKGKKKERRGRGRALHEKKKVERRFPHVLGGEKTSGFQHKKKRKKKGGGESVPTSCIFSLPGKKRRKKRKKEKKKKKWFFGPLAIKKRRGGGKKKRKGGRKESCALTTNQGKGEKVPGKILSSKIHKEKKKKRKGTVRHALGEGKKGRGVFSSCRLLGPGRLGEKKEKKGKTIL